MCFLCRRGILGTQTCIPDPNSWPGLNHRCPLKKPPPLPAALRTLGWLNVSAKCKTKADIAEVPESSTPSVSGLHINSLARYYLRLQPMIMLSHAHHHSPYIGTERAIAGLPSDCKSWAGWVARRFSVAETWAGSSGEPRGAGSSTLGLRYHSNTADYQVFSLEISALRGQGFSSCRLVFSHPRDALPLFILSPFALPGSVSGITHPWCSLPSQKLLLWPHVNTETICSFDFPKPEDKLLKFACL